jgi:hypothetical protein
MSVPYCHSMTPAASPAGFCRRILHTYLPPAGAASPSWGWCRRLRLHFPEIVELLEDWYDRAAESCDKFVNISQVDKYSVTCTVCRHFDTSGCCSSSPAVELITLLQKAREHDMLP